MDKDKALEIAEKRAEVEHKARYGRVNVRGDEERGSGGVPIRGTSTILVDSTDDRFNSIGSRIYFEANSNWGRESSFLYAASRDWSNSGGVYLSGNNRDERGSEIESSGFSIYFSSRKEVEELAKALLDEFDIQEATDEYIDSNVKPGYYKPELHPDTFGAYPNVEEKLKIKTGDYYWDAEARTVVKITEDTPQEILDQCWDHNIDEDTGKVYDDYTNECARRDLHQLENPEVQKTWVTESGIKIDVPRLATFVGGRDNGFYHTKIRVKGDKRRKMYTTTFVYQDRSTVTIDGKWEVSDRWISGSKMELIEDIDSQYQRKELRELGLIN